jgi:anti-sigma regulatory factor (Ser/Thr protein kinase)
LTFRFVGPAEDPAQARQAVRSVLGQVDSEVRETVELLVSELVTNTIVHGSGDAALLVEVGQGCVHVEVADSDPTLDLEPLRVEPTSEHGRGLAIVDALASSWGIEPRLVGKAVWFDLMTR